MVVSIVAALASAAMFAVTTNLQREAASRVPVHGGGPVHLVRRLVADPRWLLAAVIGGLALVLHGLALARGSVLVVQSVMALGLVIALSLEAFRHHRRLRPTELGGAVLVVGGVTAIVAAGRPVEGRLSADVWILVAAAALVLATFALIIRSRHAVGTTWEARLLAGAGGACFAVDAVFLQRLAAVLDPKGATPIWTGFDAVATGTDLVGFFAASMAGGIAIHRAYQVAPLREVQPTLAASEPVTAFAVSAVLLHEGVRWGALGYGVVVLGLVAITVGLFTGLRGCRTVSAAVPSTALETPERDPALTPGR